MIGFWGICGFLGICSRVASFLCFCGGFFFDSWEVFAALRELRGIEYVGLSVKFVLVQCEVRRRSRVGELSCFRNGVIAICRKEVWVSCKKYLFKLIGWKPFISMNGREKDLETLFRLYRRGSVRIFLFRNFRQEFTPSFLKIELISV